MSNDLGAEMTALAVELLEDFGSTVVWHRKIRTETSLGEFDTQEIDYSVRGAPVSTQDLQMFGLDTIQQSAQQLLVAAESLPWDPSIDTSNPEVQMLDEVELQPGRRSRIVRIATGFAPGGDGPPVPVYYVAYLGA